jgi:alkanesulfonate monooxygenase SsuD/methylene tetrahydromethanopterin reductase-like flavin-dependent oxidoreductase (luciferase family)
MIYMRFDLRVPGMDSSPMVMAPAMAAVTVRTLLPIAALLLPYCDPVRLAENMTMFDHLSGGRVSCLLVIGYRPEEYTLYDPNYDCRGAHAEANRVHRS